MKARTNCQKNAKQKKFVRKNKLNRAEKNRNWKKIYILKIEKICRKKNCIKKIFVFSRMKNIWKSQTNFCDVNNAGLNFFTIKRLFFFWWNLNRWFFLIRKFWINDELFCWNCFCFFQFRWFYFYRKYEQWKFFRNFENFQKKFIKKNNQIQMSFRFSKSRKTLIWRKMLINEMFQMSYFFLRIDENR